MKIILQEINKTYQTKFITTNDFEFCFYEEDCHRVKFKLNDNASLDLSYSRDVDLDFVRKEMREAFIDDETIEIDINETEKILYGIHFYKHKKKLNGTEYIFNV